MKTFILLFSALTFSAFAQDPASYLKNFESRVYSLKTKGVRDFVVDIENPRITKQINDQQIFGKIDKVIFRTYWTSAPERIAIEVIGLPEGFREVKEELKGSVAGYLDGLVPMSFEQRFPGYKFSKGTQGKDLIAQDTTKVALIPSYTLKFDAQDKLTEIAGHKPIGTLVMNPVYEKESFADGKWVLTEQKTTSTDAGQTVVVEKEFDYGKSEGISVLKEIELSTEQKLGEAKPTKFSEKVTFSNYKINSGDALKYFLGESKEAPKK